MNLVLFEKQMIELLHYFTTHQNTMILTKREHTYLIKGTLFILSKCSEHIDFTDYLSQHSMWKAKNKTELQNTLQTLIEEISNDERINYLDIVELLRISIHCFSESTEADITGEEWLNLANDFRVLEMERLSIH